MEVGQNSVTVTRSKLEMVPGGYSMVSFTEDMQEKIRKEYASKNLDSILKNPTL